VTPIVGVLLTARAYRLMSLENVLRLEVETEPERSAPLVPERWRL
jgi:hypothetical protein